MRFILIVLVFAVSSAVSQQLDYNVNLVDKKGKTVTLKSYKGKSLLIVYYSLTCAKCKKAIRDIIKITADKKCIQIVGVVTSSETEKCFRSDTTRYPFPHFYDKWKNFKTAFNIEQVPLLVVSDSNGKILYNNDGYFEDSFSELLSALQIYLCEKPFTKPELHEKYYGTEVCAACHFSIHKWWKDSKHANAYDQVAKKYFGRSGFRVEYADRVSPAVLARTTTGFGLPGGYDPQNHKKYLLGVQCESCHSAGGPHDGNRTRDMQGQCAKCHNSKDDPTFEYRSSLRKLAHPKNR
jgi:thioredoxin-related protein